MRTALSIAALASLALAAPGRAATDQRVRSVKLEPCREHVWAFPLDWADWVAKAPESGVMAFATRAVFHLPGEISLTVGERPEIGEDTSFNSEIIVRRQRVTPRVFALRKLVKGGEYFRFVQAGSVCSSSNAGAVLLAFETAFTGADEAFVVVRYSHRGVRAYGLPPAHEARAVLWSGDDSQVEIWSGSEEAATPIDCDACARYYSILRCSVTAQRAHCKLLRKTSKPLMPDRFMGHRIKIIPKRKRRR